jgi:Domain of unknown function (DUF6894)
MSARAVSTRLRKSFNSRKPASGEPRYGPREVIAVPRYLLTIQASDGHLEDDRISEALPDITAALAHAEHMIRELQKEDGYDDPGLKMFVKDESRQTVLFSPFVAYGD